MTDLSQREAVCRSCPERRTSGLYRWCAAEDETRAEHHDCSQSRSSRFSARLTLPQATCERWRSMAECFSVIYRENLWDCEESRSGSGSTLARTAALRTELPGVLAELGCRSILDVPCGDYGWMAATDLGATEYVGADIVPELIDANRGKYPRVDFRCLDALIDPLPKTDAILCRALLTHLSLVEGVKVLARFKGCGAKYLLATTYPGTTRNTDVYTGGFRPVNLAFPPYSLGPPARLLTDHDEQAIGVWTLEPCPICSIADPIPEPEQPRVRAAWRNDETVAEQHRFALEKILCARFAPPAGLTGDGIVYCGEGKYWPGIVVAVRLLRETGCTLPVQVWHRGLVGRELDDDPLTRLVDAEQFRRAHPARILRGWEIKTYAIAHSGFRRVLYLDADAYCVADPTPVFRLENGCRFAFWRDLHHCDGAVHWNWYGLRGDRVPPIQGGQLLIDVPAFWRELMIAHWINQHSDYFYAHQFGDQDSWRVALAGTRGSYHEAGVARWRRIAFVCDLGDVPLIVHRCRAKLLPGKPARRNGALPMEDRVFELYAEIADGRPEPPQTPKSRRELAHAARGR